MMTGRHFWIVCALLATAAPAEGQQGGVSFLRFDRYRTSDQAQAGASKALAGMKKAARGVEKAREQRARLAEDLAEAERELFDLALEKDQALEELRLGLYCSQCGRPKSQIEREEKKAFAEHLVDVNGRAIPADRQRLAQKGQEYDQKIAAAEKKANGLRDRLRRLDQDFRRSRQQARDAASDYDGAIEAERRLFLAERRAEELRREARVFEAEDRLAAAEDELADLEDELWAAGRPLDSADQAERERLRRAVEDAATELDALEASHDADDRRWQREGVERSRQRATQDREFGDLVGVANPTGPERMGSRPISAPTYDRGMAGWRPPAPPPSSEWDVGAGNGGWTPMQGSVADILGGSASIEAVRLEFEDSEGLVELRLEDGREFIVPADELVTPDPELSRQLAEVQDDLLQIEARHLGYDRLERDAAEFSRQRRENLEVLAGEPYRDLGEATLQALDLAGDVAIEVTKELSPGIGRALEYSKIAVDGSKTATERVEEVARKELLFRLQDSLEKEIDSTRPVPPGTLHVDGKDLTEIDRYPWAKKWAKRIKGAGKVLEWAGNLERWRRQLDQVGDPLDRGLTGLLSPQPDPAARSIHDRAAERARTQMDRLEQEYRQLYALRRWLREQVRADAKQRLRQRLGIAAPGAGLDAGVGTGTERPDTADDLNWLRRHLNEEEER